MATPSYRDAEEKLVVTIPTGFIHGKHNVTSFLTVAILLFFLPFITITCNDVQLADATGLEISTGFKIEPGKNFENIGKSLFDKATKEVTSENDTVTEENKSNTEKPVSIGETFPGAKKNEEKAVGPNYFMMGALACGVLALIFSLVPFKKRWLVCAVTAWIGVAAFVMAVLVILDRTREFRVDIGVIKLSVNFTIWFFLSLAGFIAAAVFSHKHNNREWSLAKQKEIDEFIRDSAYNPQVSSEGNERKESNG
jgi:lysylphosphatidylglycerol synthetase-like protein (DUF2156 family)